MKAFVFAAGVGSRLKPWTQFHPKALAKVGNKPLLDINIKKIGNLSEIESIIVNVHHFHRQIEEHIAAKRQSLPKPICISDESEKLLDTGGALLKARDIIGKEDVLVHNVDILTDLDIQSMISYHKESGNDVTLLVMNRETSRKLLFDDNYNLKGWINKSTGEKVSAGANNSDLNELAFGGIHILSPKAVSLLSEYSGSIENDVFSVIKFYLWAMNRLTIKGFKPTMNYRWIDVGKPETLEIAQEMFKNE